MKQKTVLMLLSIMLLLSRFCWSQEEEGISVIGPAEVYMVLTAKKGFAKDVFSIPANITVITSEQIEKSGVTTIGELLRRESGIFIRDLYYNSGYASVDIRGFGESAPQNCVILIDGRKINNIDMSNVDLNQISLAHIEKIEILRGGISALYGDSAVGGVINIITKKPAKKKINLGTDYNSFGGYNLNFSIEKSGKLSYLIGGSNKYNHGYRKNSESSTSDFQTRVSGTENISGISWDLNAGFYANIAHFPGWISQDDWGEGKIEKTYSPDDKGSTIDWYLRAGFKKIFGMANTETVISYRNRESKSSMVSWASYDKRYTKILGIEEKLSGKIKKIVDFLCGIEYYGNFYNIVPLTPTEELTPPKDDQKLECRSLGTYLNFSIPIIEKFSIEAGGRIEKFDQHFMVESANSDETKTEILNAISIGLNWFIKEKLSSYIRCSKSFRLPKTDEYYTWGVYNQQLKPQTSQDIELGMKYGSNRINTNFSIFSTEVKDEIYYHYYGLFDPRNKNENYPSPTLRQGCELTAKINPLEKVSLFCGYTLADAKFKNGPYDRKKVPLVPLHKYNLGVSFILPYEINLELNTTTVDERYFGSDYDQTGNKLSGYTVADLNIWYQIGSARIFGTINNIGDGKYAEFAYSGVYYPSPVRNFSLGISINF